MTNQQILKIYIHNDRSDKDLFHRVKLVGAEAEAFTICETFKPRHQWEDREFTLFANTVRRKLQPLAVMADYS